MTTQAEFFQAHAVDGQLTNEQMGQMLSLPEGDTVFTESSVPAAALESDAAAAATEVKVPATAAPVAPPAPAADTPQVILAKDGVHTIPYEKLTEARAAEQAAREAERVARAEAEALRQQLEAAKQPPSAAAAAPAADTQLDMSVFGDFSEEEIAKGVKTLVSAETAAIKADLEARFAAVMEPIQQQQVMSAEEVHYSTITAKHPDAEAIAESAEMAAYINAQPTFVRPALQKVLTEGTAAEVVELLDNFKASTGKTAAAPARVDVAAAAQAAIDKAQARPPTSLSEIPAGSTAHHDEAEAMLAMSNAGLEMKFEGKTPEQIMALMSKVI